MVEMDVDAPRRAHGLPFGVWWAIGEAVAAVIALLVLRLLGAI